MNGIIKGSESKARKIVFLALALFALLAKAWNTSGAGTETHAPMTTRAIMLVHDKYPGQYPDIDLNRFGNDIVNGSSGGQNDEDYTQAFRFGYIHGYPHGHKDDNDVFNYTELSRHKWFGTDYPNAVDPEEEGILDYYKKRIGVNASLYT
jgi:hypothetical protein